MGEAPPSPSSSFCPRGFGLRDDLSKFGIHFFGGKPTFFIGLTCDTLKHLGEGSATRLLLFK